MANCLITKLKESVNNNNLLKLGELVLKVGSKDYVVSAAIKTKNEQVITLTNGLYFTDDAGANLGKIKIINSDNTNFKISKGTGDLVISNKYDLLRIFVQNIVSSDGSNVRDIFYIPNIEDLEYCTKMDYIKQDYISSSIGDISVALSNMKNMTYLNANDNKCISGELDSLLENTLTQLNYFSITNNNNISFDLSSVSSTDLGYFAINNMNSVIGDIATLSSKMNGKSSGSTTLRLESCNGISGDISNLINANLNYVTISKCPKITSSNFQNFINSNTSLSALYLTNNINMSLTGDASKLSSKLYIASLSGTENKLTWTSRPSTSSAFSIADANFGTQGDNSKDLENMLRDMSACTTKYFSSSAKKFIRVTGHLTDNCTEYINALKEKGFTVTINGVTK